MLGRYFGACRPASVAAMAMQAIAVSHYLPLPVSVSRRNARSGFRAVCRRAEAMQVWPAKISRKASDRVGVAC